MVPPPKKIVHRKSKIVNQLMLSDIEIAQKAKLEKILPLAKKQLGIPENALEPFGHFKAKIDPNWLEKQPENPNSKLILVTAISPTPAGEGKTTTVVGLGDALKRIGKKTIICLREPSLGPVFGMKGGAAGGGFSQVVPMEDINLHFTGDFNAIGLANNLLSALIDNHIHHGNELQIDVRRITWRRVMDMNDRALRKTVVSLGGVGNGFPREDGFDIVVASEVMAILCLATSLEDLKNRLGNIVLGFNTKREPVRARDLDAHGAMTVLLKEAIKPNIVQTLEHTPAFIHGGPFANIAHGCNSVMATKNALKLADFVVTEAGFGADLGAEKFVDIKCRKSGLRPDAVVIVATIKALKYHGGIEVKDVKTENLVALELGFPNLARHIENVQKNFGLPCIVAVNHFYHDSEAEISWLQEKLESRGVPVSICKHWAAGGAGAEDLAKKIVQITENQTTTFQFVYPDDLPIWEKMRAVATKIYGASDIVAEANVLAEIKKIEAMGCGHFPICVAKTQYSFSSNPKLRGAPTGHVLNVREVRLAAGAEFVVMICGEIMTMPGLPKEPSAMKIDIDKDGKVVGLF